MSDVPEIVAKTLDELAARFGATGAELWHAYIRYLLIEGVSSVVAYGLLLALGYAAYKFAARIWALDNSSDLQSGMSIVASIVAVVLVVVGVCGIQSSLTEALAPNGYAVSQLLPRCRSSAPVRLRIKEPERDGE